MSPAFSLSLSLVATRNAHQLGGRLARLAAPWRLSLNPGRRRRCLNVVVAAYWEVPFRLFTVIIIRSSLLTLLTAAVVQTRCNVRPIVLKGRLDRSTQHRNGQSLDGVGSELVAEHHLDARLSRPEPAKARMKQLLHAFNAHAWQIVSLEAWRLGSRSTRKLGHVGSTLQQGQQHYYHWCHYRSLLGAHTL
jgi:hypothetical protein